MAVPFLDRKKSKWFTPIGVLVLAFIIGMTCWGYGTLVPLLVMAFAASLLVLLGWFTRPSRTIGMIVVLQDRQRQGRGLHRLPFAPRHPPQVAAGLAGLQDACGGDVRPLSFRGAGALESERACEGGPRKGGRRCADVQRLPRQPRRGAAGSRGDQLRLRALSCA